MKIKFTGLKKIHMMKMNLHAVLIYINRQTMILIQNTVVLLHCMWLPFRVYGIW